MKKFENPEMEIIKFSFEDIMSASDPNEGGEVFD